MSSQACILQAITDKAKMSSMRSFEEKFDALLRENNTSAYKVALSVGMDPSLLGKIIAGSRPASFEKKLEILQQVSTSPLLKVDYNELVELLVQDYIPPQFLPSKTLELASTSSAHQQVPVKGYVSAGVLTLSEEVDLGTVTYRGPQVEGIFALSVRGDSMEPKLPDGSTIFVKPCSGFRKGHWYVVQTHDGESTVKIVEAGPRGLILKPINPAYDPVEVSNKDVRCVWEVVECTFRPGK